MTITTTVYDPDFTEQLEEVYNDRTRDKEINGRTYRIRCTDPYGAWIIEKTQPGKMPEMFNQNFTTTDDAWKVVQAYENANKTRLDDQTEKKLKKIKTIEL